MPSGPSTGQKLSLEQVLRRLQEAYPKAFTNPPTPLQLGIHKVIRDAKPATLESISSNQLSSALRSWVRRDAYLQAVRDRVARIGLDGQPAGEVSDEAAAEARRALKRRIKKRKQGNKRRAEAASKRASTEPRSTNSIAAPS